MKIFTELSQLNIEGGSSVVLGKFAGLHLGHRLLIKEMIKRRGGLTSCVLMIKIPENPGLISFDEFAKRLERLGVDILVSLELSPELMSMSHEDFLTSILIKKLHMKEMVAGPDVAFGKNAAGNGEFLKANQEKYGYKFSVIPKVTYEGDAISSSRIKETLEKGDLVSADIMLGNRVNAFKGGDVDGVLIIDKPMGFTSQDVVSKLRGMLHIKKIGHTGTLDPGATGVLPILIGRATKLSDMLMSETKIYEASLKLGIKTDTQDIWGKVIATRAAWPAEADVYKALKHFTGMITQIPPMYSAIKINGEKLCDLARKGIEVERKPREIYIEKIEVLGFRQPEIDIRVYCSKGTYIRTLCNDIGDFLGCGGAMSSLRRVASGNFDIQSSLTLSELQNLIDKGESLDNYILGLNEVLKNMPELVVSPEYDKALMNGNEIRIKPSDTVKAGDKYLMKSSNGSLIGIYKYDNNGLRPDTMLN